MDREAEGHPQKEGPRLEELARASAAAITASLVELIRAVRQELEAARRMGEAFVGRVLVAVSRSAWHLRRALTAWLLTSLFAIVATVLIAWFLMDALNGVLGEPWGTGVAGLLFLAGALAFALRGRRAIREVAREGEALLGRR